jgi:hypothetical protein
MTIGDVGRDRFRPDETEVEVDIGDRGSTDMDRSLSVYEVDVSPLCLRALASAARRLAGFLM